MKVTPFKNLEMTFLRLSLEEWVFNFVVILFFGGFIGGVLSILELSSHYVLIPLVIFLVSINFVFISLKGREQNFLRVWWVNRNLPNIVIGRHPPLLPLDKETFYDNHSSS